MSFWFFEVLGIYWSVIFLGIMFGFNVIFVCGFGESEFWFVLIKVVMVVIFIGVGLVIIFGIMYGVELFGFSNFIMGDVFFVGGFQVMVGVVMIVGFLFQGIELIGIVVGELENLWKNILIVICQVFWCILMFYILVIFVIGMLIFYIDLNLLKNDVSDISVLFFILFFECVGFVVVVGVMNVVIFLVIFFVGNFGMYVLIWMFYNFVFEGKVLCLFFCVLCSGVLCNVLYVIILVGVLCFFILVFGDSIVYIWLLNILGMCGFIVWLGIVIFYYCFCKGYLVQGGCLEDLFYWVKLFFFGLLFVFVLCMVIIFGQNYQVLVGECIDWIGFFVIYISLLLFLVIWLGYCWKKCVCFVCYYEMDVSLINI